MEDEAHCTERIAWSGTFASHIRKSVAESAILGFLSTEYSGRGNIIQFPMLAMMSAASLILMRLGNVFFKFWGFMKGTKQNDGSPDFVVPVVFEVL